LSPGTASTEIVTSENSRCQNLISGICKDSSSSESLRFPYHDTKFFLRILHKFSHEVKYHFPSMASNIFQGLFVYTNVVISIYSKKIQHILIYFYCSLSWSLAQTKKKLNGTTPTLEGQLSGVEIKIAALFYAYSTTLETEILLIKSFFGNLSKFSRQKWRSRSFFTISGEYYNRFLSGWECFLKPCKCFVHWSPKIRGQLLFFTITGDSDVLSRHLQLEVITSHKNVLDINNITSTLPSLYSTVQANWPEDYSNAKADINDALSLFLIFRVRMKRARHCDFPQYFLILRNC